MKKVLITGGCGFVGANLIPILQREFGCEVVVVDNESLGKYDHIAVFDVQFERADVRDVDAVRAALRGVDAVVHLAADTRVIDSIADPVTNFDVNVRGTFQLLELCREAGITRFVNASTGGAILGEATPPIHEGLPPRPLSPYGASKLATEGYCSAFAGSYGFHTVSLRFSNVYGPGSFHKGSVVATFFRRILSGKELVIYGDGSQVRDYVYVGDLCAGIAKAMAAGATGVYQLGSGVPLRLDSLAAAMIETVGPSHRVSVRHEAFRPGEIHSTWCDISSARSAFGFAPSTTLQTGLAHTWRWFLDQEGTR